MRTAVAAPAEPPRRESFTVTLDGAVVGAVERTDGGPWTGQFFSDRIAGARVNVEIPAAADRWAAIIAVVEAYRTDRPSRAARPG